MWVQMPCPIPDCTKTHPTWRAGKRGPARPYDGPVTSPLRPESRPAPTDSVGLGGPAETASALPEASGHASVVPQDRHGPPAGKPLLGTVESPASRRRRVAPLPVVGGPTPETPRDGRESSLAEPPGRSRSRSSQAASPRPSVFRGSTG